jgi:ribosomal protein L14
MVQSKTLINVVDNSGISLVKCLQVRGSGCYKKRSYRLGDLISVSIKKHHKDLRSMKLEGRRTLLARIVGTCSPSRRKDGVIMYGSQNKAAVFYEYEQHSGSIMRKKLRPLGRKLFATVPKELRKSSLRLYAMAAYRY